MKKEKKVFERGLITGMFVMVLAIIGSLSILEIGLHIYAEFILVLLWLSISYWLFGNLFVKLMEWLFPW